jgi:hypothetical protein
MSVDSATGFVTFLARDAVNFAFLWEGPMGAASTCMIGNDAFLAGPDGALIVGDGAWVVSVSSD